MMQKAIFPVLTVILVTIVLNSSVAQNKNKEKKEPKVDKINWYSFEDAYQLNKKKQKKIFIDVYTDWCGWCKKMDAETFTNPVIIEYMSRHFYCVKLDAERKDTVIIDGVTFVNPSPSGKRASHQLAVELLKGKMSYPSYVFLNEKSQWMTVLAGYQPAKEFEIYLHYFGDGAYDKQIPFDDFKASFTGEIK
jgi:thioredoxin-related protein